MSLSPYFVSDPMPFGGASGHEKRGVSKNYALNTKYQRLSPIFQGSTVRVTRREKSRSGDLHLQQQCGGGETF
jgi:hypothetical protein